MAITSQDVAQAVATLEANQKKVSVRAVQAITGGSTATVYKHLKPLLTPASPNPNLELDSLVEQYSELLSESRNQFSTLKRLIAQVSAQATNPNQVPTQVRTPVQVMPSSEELKEFHDLVGNPEGSSLLELFQYCLEQLGEVTRSRARQFARVDELEAEVETLKNTSQPDAKSNKLELDLIEANQQIRALRQRCESAEESRDNLARKLYEQ